MAAAVVREGEGRHGGPMLKALAVSLCGATVAPSRERRHLCDVRRISRDACLARRMSSHRNRQPRSYQPTCCSVSQLPVAPNWESKPLVRTL